MTEISAAIIEARASPVSMTHTDRSKLESHTGLEISNDMPGAEGCDAENLDYHYAVIIPKKAV